MTIIPFPKKDPAKLPQPEILWPKGQQLLDLIRDYERMKAALRKIAEMPYDDKEEEYPDDDGHPVYMWLREDETRDYLYDAVDTAYKALMGRG